MTSENVRFIIPPSHIIKWSDLSSFVHYTQRWYGTFCFEITC